MTLGLRPITDGGGLIAEEKRKVQLGKAEVGNCGKVEGSTGRGDERLNVLHSIQISI